MDGHGNMTLAVLITALATMAGAVEATCGADAPPRFMNHPLVIRCKAAEGSLTYSIALEANDRKPVVTKEIRITFRGTVKSVLSGPGWKWRKNHRSHGRTTEIVWERDPSSQVASDVASEFVVVVAGSEAGLACPHVVEYENQQGQNPGEMIGCPIA